MDNKKRKLSTSFIKNIISSLGVNTNNFALVKHYGKFSIDMEDARNAMMSYDNVDIYYSHFANNEMVGSFEPFLTIVKNCYLKYYSDKSIDEYLSLFNIYSLHKPFFKSYIEAVACERYEPYILNDIDYEKKKMFESMTYIIIELSKKHPMLIIIDNIHMVTKSTIAFLKQLIDNPDNKNIGLFAAYNDLKNVRSIDNDEWNQYIKIATTKHFIYEGGVYESKEDTEEPSKFVFDSKRAYEYLLKLKLMYCVVDFEQADFYLQKIYEKLSNEKMNIDFTCKYELFKLYTQVLIYLEDFSTALLICDNLKEMCMINPQPEFEYEYHSLYAYTQIYSGKPEHAKTSIERCKEIALELNDENYIFKADLLMYMSKMNGWHNIYLLPNDIEIADSFLKKVEEQGYINHLAYLYIYAYDNDSQKYKNLKTNEEYSEKQAKLNEGITLAEKIGNYCLIQKAYQKAIMMSSSIGLFNITQYYYNKMIDLIDNELVLADIKNGQGYGYCTCRKFEEANKSYNTALSIFMKHGDIKSAGETLYNMALNCILAGDYHNAYNYLKICIRIVEKMRLNDLRVCNLAKLYGLLALSSYRLSYEYDCIFYLNTNKKFLEHIINNRTYRDANKINRAFTGNDDELYLHYLVKGLLDYKNEEYENSLDNYKLAEKHCLKSDGNLFFSFVQLKIAMADTYNKLNRKADALQVIDEAHKFATEKDYNDQIIALNNMKETGEYVFEPKELPLNNYTLEDASALLDKSSVIAQHQDMQNQLEFISIWQNILEIHEKTKEELINTAANSFMLNFGLDSFLFIKFYEDSAEVMFNEGCLELTKKDIEILRDYFEKTKTGFVTAKSDKNYDDYKKILDMFGMDVLCSIVCNPFFENEKLDSLFISCIYMKTNWSMENYRYLLNESDSAIFNLSLRQLLLAIDKIEYLSKIKQINIALKDSSFTDYLTGLRNRNGFYEKVNYLIDNSSDTPLSLAILYIDLDNFKYYNDTFGHDVGDLILKEIAAILNNSAGENGFAVRYGGDEFLIILMNSTKEEALATAKMTLDTILMRNGFAHEISILLEQQVAIDREKKVSCSIGVSFSPNVRSNHELSELIKNADSSLYSVKHTTKNAVKFFEE
ncbi:MAG: GGDEF domain-containing protein [Lachnospiraceae bacterium]|nr:GGDEF domain-containing protein [Lachnospiraceae bacterium]